MCKRWMLHIYMYKDIDMYVKMCGVERYSNPDDTVSDYNFTDGDTVHRFSDRHAHGTDDGPAIGAGGCAVRAAECR